MRRGRVATRQEGGGIWVKGERVMGSGKVEGKFGRQVMGGGWPTSPS